MSLSKWDAHWLILAELVASASKDPSTKTGAVIIRPDNSMASVGYNGFPRKMPDTESNYLNREEKYSRIIHCEINSILHLRERADGYTLYTWPFLTCDRCAVQVIQAGITRVVAPICPPEQATRWEETFKKARQYYKECGVECVEV